MQDVAIFWDYENCAPPSNASGYIIANNIRLMAQAYGSVKSLKAYLEITDQTSSTRALALRSEFQASGVSLVDCPHNGRKEVADKMIIVDMLAYAIDNPAPSVIVLISGDRDFAYALSILRLRQYQIILVTLSNAHPSLTSQASTCIDWHSTIINPVIEPPPRTTDNFVGSVTRTTSYRNGLPGEASPSRSSPSQSLPSQASQRTQETENIGRADHGDLLHYLRASTSGRARRPSEAPSFSTGQRARYESPRQDPSPAIEVELGYTRPSLASNFTTESVDSSVSNNSSPAARSISNPVQNRDSTLASETKDAVAGPTDTRIFWSSTNEEAFSTSLPKTDKSTVPALLPSIMQETPQPSPVAQYAVLEIDIPDEDSTSGLPSIYPTRPASAPHSLPSQSPLVPLISAVEPLASETATMLPGFPDAEALPVSVDNITTNQQHILAVQEASGKSVFPAVSSTSLSDASIAMSEEICSNPGLDSPHIDPTYRQSSQQITPIANSGYQPSIMALPTQGSPSIAGSPKIIDRLPLITPIISSIDQAGPSTTDSQNTINRLPPTTLSIPSVNQTNPSTKVLQNTIDRLHPITPTISSINQAGQPVSNFLNLIDTPPSTIASWATYSSKPKAVVKPEAVVKPGAVVPLIFKILVDTLRIEKARGSSRPLRSFVAEAMYKKGFKYDDTGTSNFGQYTSLAEQRGIVELGSNKTDIWISLKPEYQHECYAPPPAPVVAPIFKILVDTLKVNESNGILRPSRSNIAIAISRNGLTYKEAGVNKFSHYVALAEKEGIVELGGRESDPPWISLRPAYRNALTT